MRLNGQSGSGVGRRCPGRGTGWWAQQTVFRGTEQRSPGQGGTAALVSRGQLGHGAVPQEPSRVTSTGRPSHTHQALRLVPMLVMPAGCPAGGHYRVWLTWSGGVHTPDDKGDPGHQVTLSGKAEVPGLHWESREAGRSSTSYHPGPTWPSQPRTVRAARQSPVLAHRHLSSLQTPNPCVPRGRTVPTAGVSRTTRTMALPVAAHWEGGHPDILRATGHIGPA